MKKVLFITGTRADYGKLKPLIAKVEGANGFDCHIFVTGMHTLRKFGDSRTEVKKDRFKNLHYYYNQILGEPMDLILANTVEGLGRYVRELQPDIIIVHGDRVEALAGAISGALNNILVAHIEGGELSGTIDGVIRHAVTKLSHIHFVANDEAAKRLHQLGEDQNAVFVIGSPDIDIMLSPDLPTIEQVKQRYDIDYEKYAILLYHPVTTEPEQAEENANRLVDAVILSRLSYVVIYPNNDPGSDEIFKAYKGLTGANFKVYPTIRFEYFLTLLKNAEFLIGNSSAGIREAPAYGVYSINVGTRQQDRCGYASIINTGYNTSEIAEVIETVKDLPAIEPCHMFGRGDSAEKFIAILREKSIWKTPKQKKFWDQ